MKRFNPSDYDSLIDFWINDKTDTPSECRPALLAESYTSEKISRLNCRNSTLYSYTTPIARRLKNKYGEHIYIVSSYYYSATTAKQLRKLRWSICDSGSKYIEVQDIEHAESIEDILSILESGIQSLCEIAMKYRRARTDRYKKTHKRSFKNTKSMLIDFIVFSRGVSRTNGFFQKIIKNIEIDLSIDDMENKIQKYIKEKQRKNRLLQQIKESKNFVVSDGRIVAETGESVDLMSLKIVIGNNDISTNIKQNMAESMKYIGKLSVGKKEMYKINGKLYDKTSIDRIINTDD